MSDVRPHAPEVQVSVLITTYDHEAWIGRAIEGVLEQTGVTFELIVGDDCSRDGTREVVDAYARRHPGLVRTHYPEHNLGGDGKVLWDQLIARSRGRYVAGLDGDDYWTAPEKLLRQTTYLDEHPQCSMVFHNVLRHVEGGAVPDVLHHPPDHPRRMGWPELLGVNPVASVSPLFRREVLSPLPDWYFDMPWGDWPLYLLAAGHGELHYEPDVMAVYRVHPQGMYTGQASLVRRQQEVDFFRRLEGVLPAAQEGLRRRRLALALTRLAAAHLRAGDTEAARRRLAESFRVQPLELRRWRGEQPERTRVALWARTRVPLPTPVPGRARPSRPRR